MSAGMFFNGGVMLLVGSALHWFTNSHKARPEWETLLFAGLAWLILGGILWAFGRLRCRCTLCGRYRLLIERRRP